MTDEKNKLTHVDESGQAHMVDVGHKPETARVARASALLRMKPETLVAIREDQVKKGAVLSVARIAGIQGAKQTSTLIPLCHPLALSQLTVEFEFPSDSSLLIQTSARTIGQTGVEMEALCAASISALTVYDMCKAIDREMQIQEIVLVHKSGGKSGDYDRV